MDIRFACDKCGQHLVMDATGIGLAVQCTLCGSSFTVTGELDSYVDSVDRLNFTGSFRKSVNGRYTVAWGSTGLGSGYGFMMVYLLLRDGVVLVRGKRTNIQKAVVADNGTFLVFHCTESLSDVLTVFDSNGRELKQMKLVGVGYPFLNLQKGVASLEIPADSASGTPGRFIFSLLDGSVEVVEPEGECGHCGKLKSRRMLTACESCEEIICPDCKARGCDGPKPPPEPRDAIQCCSRASDAMLGQKLPLEKDVAERVVQFCDRALKFGFAAHHRDIEARAHRMRGEALESLSQHGQALKEYELAFEKDPKVGVKQRIASLRKRCGQSQGESANGGAT